MRVESFVPDVAPPAPDRAPAAGFEAILDALGGTLQQAETAEDRFAQGSGDLQSAVYARARADVALSVATAAAQRAAQALQSILNMQV